MEMYIISAKLSVVTPPNLNPYANLVHIPFILILIIFFVSYSLLFSHIYTGTYRQTVGKDADETMVVDGN